MAILSFGRQSSTVKKFIKKSCEFANTISFILPKSFKKDSLKKTFPLNWHLLFEEDLPENSFTNSDKLYNIPTIFQIWTKKSFQREIKNISIPTYFSFVKKSECNSNCVSFRRVGVNAGTFSKNIEDKSEQSHYFIKLNNIQIDNFLEKIKECDFTHNNTVGPKSISKPELIEQINDLF